MRVTLTPDQKAFIRQAIEAGRIARPEDAAAEAMALWEERERRRAEILAHMDLAEASQAQGEGIVVTKDPGSLLALRPVTIRGEGLSATIIRDRR
jgi:Arc/MetJ-type ribon-helix-helix transcriptional regulator